MKVRRGGLMASLGVLSLAGLLGVAVSSGSVALSATSLTSASVTTGMPAVGYHLAAADGGVFNFGASGFYGTTYSDGITGLTGSRPLAAPIVGVVEDPMGGGYWLVGKDGGVFNFGASGFYGSTYTLGLTGLSGTHPLASPVVAMAATPDGKGYWLVTQDGTVYSFGDAKFYGSTYTLGLTGLSGRHPLSAPIVGITSTPTGGGYWLVGKDGGIFSFGDAKFYGNTYSDGLTGLSGTHPLSAPIVGMATTPNGAGYWLVGADGGIFNFGDAGFYGNTYSLGLSGLGGSHPLVSQVVGIVPTANGGGYWMATQAGFIYSFGDADFLGNTYSLGLSGLGGSHPLSAPIVGIAQ